MRSEIKQHLMRSTVKVQLKKVTTLSETKKLVGNEVTISGNILKECHKSFYKIRWPSGAQIILTDTLSQYMKFTMLGLIHSLHLYASTCHSFHSFQ